MLARGGLEFELDGQSIGGEGQGLEDVEALLSGGRDHGAQAGEVDCALRGFEAAGDFGLHLHPHIPFGEVVGEGNREIGEEPEGRVLEGLEADEEIVGGPLLLALFRVHRGIEGRQAPVQGEAFVC